MGLLDDAIREHLELKRRHGASPEEIAEEEAEALGPARRDFPAQPPPEPAEPALPPEPAESDPLAEEMLAPAIDEAEHEPSVPDEPEPETEVEPTPFEDAPAAEEGEQPPQGSDDVLEDTPEFLQDAPEHDRLWFEQKPPRDFDFD